MVEIHQVRFIDRIVEVLVAMLRPVSLLRSKQCSPRHSSGVSETHLTISSSKYRLTSFQVSRGLHSKSSTNSHSDRCPCFRKYRKPWGSAGPVHRFDRRCDSVWQHQVRIQAVQKTKEVPLVRFLISEIDIPVDKRRRCKIRLSFLRVAPLRKFTEQQSCIRVPLALR